MILYLTYSRLRLLTTVMLLFLFVGCRTTGGGDQNEKLGTGEVGLNADSEVSDVPFYIASNYFVHSGSARPDHLKIETAEKFNEVFGMATTMGLGGKPSEIDFSRQFVLAVVKPATDLMTTLRPLRVQKDGVGAITLTYQFTEGPKQTYQSIPHFIVIVDKSVDGPIRFVEIN